MIALLKNCFILKCNQFELGTLTAQKRLRFTNKQSEKHTIQLLLLKFVCFRIESVKQFHVLFFLFFVFRNVLYTIFAVAHCRCCCCSATQQRYKTFTGRFDVSNETNSFGISVLLFLHSCCTLVL